jgi:hypothetical protein
MLQIEISDFQVLSKTALVVRLGNDRDTTLSRPAQQNLCRRLSNPLGGFLNNIDIPEQRNIVRPLTERGRQLLEGLGPEGGVSRHCYVQLLSHGDESRLDQIGVVLDLEGGDGVASVGLQVVEGLCLGVGDSDGFGDAAVDCFFESFPCFTERDVFEFDGCVFGVLPPGL